MMNKTALAILAGVLMVPAAGLAGESRDSGKGKVARFSGRVLPVHDSRVHRSWHRHFGHRRHYFRAYPRSHRGHPYRRLHRWHHGYTHWRFHHNHHKYYKHHKHFGHKGFRRHR